MENKFQKWILEDERGKRPGQKYKSLLVMQYIPKNKTLHSTKLVCAGFICFTMFR